MMDQNEIYLRAIATQPEQGNLNLTTNTYYRYKPARLADWEEKMYTVPRRIHYLLTNDDIEGKVASRIRIEFEKMQQYPNIYIKKDDILLTAAINCAMDLTEYWNYMGKMNYVESPNRYLTAFESKELIEVPIGMVMLYLHGHEDSQDILIKENKFPNQTIAKQWNKEIESGEYETINYRTSSGTDNVTHIRYTLSQQNAKLEYKQIEYFFVVNCNGGNIGKNSMTQNFVKKHDVSYAIGCDGYSLQAKINKNDPRDQAEYNKYGNIWFACIDDTIII